MLTLKIFWNKSDDVFYLNLYIKRATHPAYNPRVLKSEIKTRGIVYWLGNNKVLAYTYKRLCKFLPFVFGNLILWQFRHWVYIQNLSTLLSLTNKYHKRARSIFCHRLSNLIAYIPKLLTISHSETK